MEIPFEISRPHTLSSYPNPFENEKWCINYLISFIKTKTKTKTINQFPFKLFKILSI